MLPITGQPDRSNLAIGMHGMRLATTSGSSQLTWFEAKMAGPSGRGPDALRSMPCSSSIRRETSRSTRARSRAPSRMVALRSRAS